MLSFSLFLSLSLCVSFFQPSLLPPPTSCAQPRALVDLGSRTPMNSFHRSIYPFCPEHLQIFNQRRKPSALLLQPSCWPWPTARRFALAPCLANLFLSLWFSHSHPLTPFSFPTVFPLPPFLLPLSSLFKCHLSGMGCGQHREPRPSLTTDLWGSSSPFCPLTPYLPSPMSWMQKATQFAILSIRYSWSSIHFVFSHLFCFQECFY